MKIAVADSSELAQKGIESILAESLQTDEIKFFSSHEQLLRDSQLSGVDVLIIDFMSEGFSIDSINEAKLLMSHDNILAITHEQRALTIVNALKAGVKSYVKKSCSATEIIDAVKSTSLSEAFFCGQIVEAIQAENIRVNDLSDKEFSCEPIKLSSREIEIIELISEGMTNAKIAEKLFLSSHTVNTHRKNIMQKLGVNNTAAVVMYAVKTKLISPNKFLFNSPLR